MFDDARGAGMIGVWEPEADFAAVLPLGRLRQQQQQRLQQQPARQPGTTAIISDFWLQCHLCTPSYSRLAAGERGIRGTTERRGAEMRHPADHRFDVKTVHGGGSFYMSARARGGDGQCGAVAERAVQVQGVYNRHAARLDGLAEVRSRGGILQAALID